MVVCSIRELHWSWPLAILSSLLYFFVFKDSLLYGEAGLQLVFATLALWGWWQWLRLGDDAQPALVIQRLPTRGWWLVLITSALLWPTLALLLQHFTDSDVAWWDALPTALSLVGQALLGRKYIENWLVWLVVNVISVALFAHKGLWLTCSASMNARRIAIVGAESTGKSWLTQALTAVIRLRGQTVHTVDEVLRSWCDREGRTPLPHEQAGIAHTQAQAVEQAPPGWVISDTTPLMTAVYSHMLFADESLYTMALAHQALYDHTLITGLDLPWVADGLQRDGPHVRGPVDTLVRQALDRAGINYRVVYGQGHQRLNNALLALGLPGEDEAARLIRENAQYAINQGRTVWPLDECSVPECAHQLATGPPPPPGLLALPQRQAPHEAPAGFEGPQEGLAGGDHLRWRDAHALLTAASPATRRIEAGRDGEEPLAALGPDQRATLEGVDHVWQLGEHQPRGPQRLPGTRKDQRSPGIGHPARIALEGSDHLLTQLGLHLLGLGANGGHGCALPSAHFIRQHLAQIAQDAGAQPHGVPPPSLGGSPRGLAQVAKHKGEQEAPIFIELEQPTERISRTAHQGGGGQLPAHKAAGEARGCSHEQVEQNGPAALRHGGLLSLAEDPPRHARGITLSMGGGQQVGAEGEGVAGAQSWERGDGHGQDVRRLEQLSPEGIPAAIGRGADN
eukprot:gene22089-27049_t